MPAVAMEISSMHLYNKWLPSHVVQRLGEERERFHELVATLRELVQSKTDSAALQSTYLISNISSFIGVKSEIDIQDLQEVVKLGLDILLGNCSSIFVQTKWATCVAQILSKYRKAIDLKIEWRPLYILLYEAHLKRHRSYVGLYTSYRHLGACIDLIWNCRPFFPPSSAKEIWTKFRPSLEDLSCNSSLEAAGLISLFLPTDGKSDPCLFTSKWLEECFELWCALQHSAFWSFQWASLIGRCIHGCIFSSTVWEKYLPRMFHQYLTSFHVPVGRSGSQPPIHYNIPEHIVYAFYQYHRNPLFQKCIARSIVNLLSPGLSTQTHLDVLIDVLEPYYHPSNGGSWTGSLSSLLKHLIDQFLKRISRENGAIYKAGGTKEILGCAERKSFTMSMLRLIERGQYSKDDDMAKCSAEAAAKLCYIEPDIVLPFIISSFKTAMDAVTATHQLGSGLQIISLATRPIFMMFDCQAAAEARLELAKSMFSTLPGLDANDPPKTLATLQFYTAVLSNVCSYSNDNVVIIFPVDWKQWIKELLDHLFVLLASLGSPTDCLKDDGDLEESFLMESDSHYSFMLGLLFQRMSAPFYEMALNMVEKFVRGNILPGVVDDIGTLCYAAVSSNPDVGVELLLKSVMKNLHSSLLEVSETKYGDNIVPIKESVSTTLTISQERTITYHLKVLSRAVCGGDALAAHKGLLKEIIALSFEAPSRKVNDAANELVKSLLQINLMYYPTNMYKALQVDSSRNCKNSWSFKNDSSAPDEDGTIWHKPSSKELALVQELLKVYFYQPLQFFQHLPENEKDIGKDSLRIMLLRLDAAISGLGSSLPDFKILDSEPYSSKKNFIPLTVIGSARETVTSSHSREEIACILHGLSKYMLEKWADEPLLLKLLVKLLDTTVNYGSMEEELLSKYRKKWLASKRDLTEPDTKTKCRPIWVLRERIFIHNIKRASKAYQEGDANSSVPVHVDMLMKDLQKLSVHFYSNVRHAADNSLWWLFSRYPTLIKSCHSDFCTILESTKATEQMVRGACNVLGTTIVLRHILEDLNSLSSFLTSLLKSDHHDTIKAQNAISKLFKCFKLIFSDLHSKKGADVSSYKDLILHIKDNLSTSSKSMHWRYNLMGHGILLFLGSSFEPSLDKNELRAMITGHFLNNLESDIPALRRVSITSLLFILPTSCETKINAELSTRDLLKQDFGQNIITKLALDHHYSDDEYQQSKLSDILSSYMPRYMKKWPHKNWDLQVEGKEFSPTFAKFFKRLCQVFGSGIIDILHEPLIDAAKAFDERNKQCVAAEIIAGILRSGTAPANKAWNDWLCSTLRMVVLQANLESVPEWTACINFAVGGKRCYTNGAPPLQQKILKCLSEALPENASNSLISKWITFIRAAVLEIKPQHMLEEEIALHHEILKDIVPYATSSTPQVREAVGSLICTICQHLQLATMKHIGDQDCNILPKNTHYDAIANLNGCHNDFFGRIKTVVVKINSMHEQGSSSDIDSETKEAINCMETILHYLKTSIKEGASISQAGIIVQIIYPLLQIQETSQEDLRDLAKWVLRLLRWQLFPSTWIPSGVSAILEGMTDMNWHARMSSLTFIQHFYYRHIFAMEDVEKQRIWDEVKNLLSDPQLEVRETASTTLSGLMKGTEERYASSFRTHILELAHTLPNNKKINNGDHIPKVHGITLGLASCVLSVPYDVPEWLPTIVTELTYFGQYPWPIRATVTKTIREFWRTHLDTWCIQQKQFTEDQLEALSSSVSASYFA